MEKLLWGLPSWFSLTLKNVSSLITKLLLHSLSQCWTEGLLIQLYTAYSKQIDRNVEKWGSRRVGSETT